MDQPGDPQRCQGRNSTGFSALRTFLTPLRGSGAPLPVIQLSSLTKSFGDRTLLDRVTWQIDDRERVGLSGPNGAGKTTLLRMLAGLDESGRRAPSSSPRV